MKVLTAPLTFIDGDILPPDDVNALYLYARDAVIDVASKRWAKSIFPIQCVQVVGTTIDEASGALLVHRFKCDKTCIVERVFLNANMTSSAEVTVAIIATGGSTPTGATVPLLSTGAAVVSAATATTDVNTDKFVLTAGTEYSITIATAGGATFDLHRCDITLHLAVDRWTLAGTTSVPDFDPTLLTDASMCDAAVIVANNSALTTEAAKFAAALGAPMPMVFHVHNFVIATARGLCIVKRIYVFADMNAAGGAADTVTASLLNAAAVSQATAVADVNGVAYAAGDSGALAIVLNGADAATTASDFSLVLANNDAANTCNRATVIIWVARG